MTDSTSAEFFNDKYLRNPDPWNFEKSEYEQRRYSVILNELGRRIYVRAFEPGCSVGVLTASLAGHCASLEAMDISLRAVKLAQQRCKHLSHVNVTCGSLPNPIPSGMFDLIVFSEIGYYFTEKEMAPLARVLAKRLEKGGIFLAAHWLGNSKDHLMNGDCVHRILASTKSLVFIRGRRYEAFRIDKWERS
jgi:SAM-dependent methyltransferase